MHSEGQISNVEWPTESWEPKCLTGLEYSGTIWTISTDVANGQSLQCFPLAHVLSARESLQEHFDKGGVVAALRLEIRVKTVATSVVTVSTGFLRVSPSSTVCMGGLNVWAIPRRKLAYLSIRYFEMTLKVKLKWLPGSSFGNWSRTKW